MCSKFYYKLSDDAFLTKNVFPTLRLIGAVQDAK